MWRSISRAGHSVGVPIAFAGSSRSHELSVSLGQTSKLATIPRTARIDAQVISRQAAGPVPLRVTRRRRRTDVGLVGQEPGRGLADSGFDTSRYARSISLVEHESDVRAGQDVVAVVARVVQVELPR